MVPGIEIIGSYMMTISDMSVVTSEVMVDETDIINIRVDQPATITVDALPRQTFTGRVTEVGNQAVLRSSGLASTQSTTGSQEAKDFKVVVTHGSPADGSAQRTFFHCENCYRGKRNVLAIPIQALAVRSRKQLEDAVKWASASRAAQAVAALLWRRQSR